MRRVLALLVALGLVGSFAGSGMAANPAPRSFFSGSFDLLDWDGTLLGHATADLSPPTDQLLVPGRYDFKGASQNWIRESHAVIGNAHFWYDENHLPAGAAIPGGYVARGEGVECVYAGPNDTICHAWAVQYVDNVDPSVRNEVSFEWQNPDGSWGQATQFVGKGSFVLQFSGVES